MSDFLVTIHADTLDSVDVFAALLDYEGDLPGWRVEGVESIFIGHPKGLFKPDLTQESHFAVVALAHHAANDSKYSANVS